MSECEKFLAMGTREQHPFYDLCAGVGCPDCKSPRQPPTQARSDQFRAKYGLEPIVVAPLKRTVTMSFRPGGEAKEVVTQDAGAAREPSPPQAKGPGDHLFDVLQSLGVSAKSGCGCGGLKKEMNRYGVDGCRERRTDILTVLKKKTSKYGLAEWTKAAMLAVTTGLVFRINPLDPLPGLFDEAIRRASE